MKAPFQAVSQGWWLPLFILCPTMHGAEFFAAPGGNNGNPGTLARPFATIRHGIEQLRAGDTLYLRSGRYREQVVANGLHGTEFAPICLRNYPGETAIIDGTEPISALAEGSWIRHTGAIYSIELRQDVWQLFLDGQPAQPARFPNANLLEGRIWDMRASMLRPDKVTSTGLACNNVARLGHFINGDQLPCREDHNLSIPRAAAKALRDPLNWDFRPKSDSEVVDAGRAIQNRDKPDPDTPLIPEKFLGKAPDIGAYEFGDDFYWIPGRQYPYATTPIPPDGATNVEPDAGLMFLGGFQADKHIISFGESRQALRKQAELKDTNIFSPGRLEPGQTYCWRVDTVCGGNTIDGPIWEFSVGRN